MVRIATTSLCQRRAHCYFLDDAHAARRRYKKDLDILKPDIAAYNRQKEIALGLAPGTLAKSGADSSSSTITQFDPNAAGPSTEVSCFLSSLHT